VSTVATEFVHRLSELTLEEKASLCLGSDFWHTAPVERLGIPAIMVSDGPHGLRAQLGEADHVGLQGSAPATCFPTASALGSSWNPALFQMVGEALALEAKGLGVSVVLGPGINMKRSPLCGRNFEYVSEDPWLAGVLATSMVRGTQDQGVGTSLKHYAANNQEDDRLRVSAEVDERTLREIYLPAFERVVKLAQPWTIMCAYNKINGRYASEHHWLLTEVLREEWGFEGLVVSDWGAVHDRVAALRGGLDLEMPPNLGVSDAAIVTAVRDGSLDESILDETARRVLHLVDRSQPASAEDVSFDVDKHHALARRAAQESAVLLKNAGRVLPLQPDVGSMVAVIGEFAVRRGTRARAARRSTPLGSTRHSRQCSRHSPAALRCGSPPDSAWEAPTTTSNCCPRPWIWLAKLIMWWFSSVCLLMRSQKDSTGPISICLPTSS
jgi:beta-glucosidase